MLKKGHALALAVTTAGLIGFGAPLASAATMPHGDGGGVVNVSHNQAPLQACGNTVNGNAFGGQVPVDGAAVVGSLLSPGATTNATSVDNRGCAMTNSQHEGRGSGDDGGVLNVAHNQVPAQACGNDVNGNFAGGQVPLTAVSGALAFLSPDSVTNATAVSNQGCELSNSQHG